MPFLQVDLDALDEFQGVATSAGMSFGDVAGGCLRLWEYCWRKKATHVTRERLSTFFPCPNVDRLVMALEACEFIDRPADRPDFHIRGSEKRLGLLEARAENGRRNKKNLRQFSGKRPARLRQPSGNPPAPDRSLQSSSPDLSASSKEEAGADAPAAASKPGKAPTLQVQLFGGIQAHRRSRGLAPYDETKWPPKQLNSMLKPIVGKHGVDGALGLYRTFMGQHYWHDKDPPWPLEGFCARWQTLKPTKSTNELFQYVPDEETHAEPG